MALEQREKNLLDAILEYALTETELEDLINKTLPNSIHPPNPDAEAMKYYLGIIQTLQPAKQNLVNNLNAKWSI